MRDEKISNSEIIYYFADGLFYPSDENYAEIPTGAIAVSADEFNRAMNRNPGETFTVDTGGMVTIIPVPELTHDEHVAAAEQKKQSLIDSAMQSINVIQLKLQAKRKLTNAEMERLNVVLDYIDAVSAVDTDAAPDITWPQAPDAYPLDIYHR